jgi:phosphoribosyl 1,2-cyclic phosphodiesterase
LLEVTSLGSGSCGNALLVRTPATVLLVDCGVDARRMTKHLAARGLALTNIDAVLVSHEHGDHAREAPRLAAAGAVLLSTQGTATAARFPKDCWIETRPGARTTVGDIEITPLPVDHDAAEPCGFLILSAFGAITVMTDLGRPPAGATEAIAASRLVVLEANHDVTLLRRGPYPAHLQRRILSDRGHLSNDTCASILAAALDRASRMPTVWLAHLSETNNRPTLARQTVSRRLARDGMSLDLQVLPRRDMSDVWRPDTAKAGLAQLTLGW